LIRALDPLVESRKFEVMFLGKARAEEPYAAEFLRLVKARPWCVYRGFASREELKAQLKRTWAQEGAHPEGKTSRTGSAPCTATCIRSFLISTAVLGVNGSLVGPPTVSMQQPG
jgi:hypothetical protein